MPDTVAQDARALPRLLMLIAALAAGLIVGYLLRGFQQGGYYVPVLMPAIIGWAVGTAVHYVRAGFRLQPMRPAVLAIGMGALAGYATYHVVVYLGVVDFLATKQEFAPLVDRAAAGERRAVVQEFEQRTGYDGFFAYLAFVADFRRLSPLGLLGALKPGPYVTLAGMVVEPAVAVATGSAIVYLRHEARSPQAALDASDFGGHRVREILTRTDAETLTSVMHAMDRHELETAGQFLRKPAAEERFAIAITYNPYTASQYLVEIMELEDGRPGRVRASRMLSSWEGQALHDEFRLRR